ncbi:hypothetical protein D3C73_1048440 [compost metagenome]
MADRTDNAILLIDGAHDAAEYRIVDEVPHGAMPPHQQHRAVPGGINVGKLEGAAQFVTVPRVGPELQVGFILQVETIERCQSTIGTGQVEVDACLVEYFDRMGELGKPEASDQLFCFLVQARYDDQDLFVFQALFGERRRGTRHECEEQSGKTDNVLGKRHVTSLDDERQGEL